MIAEVASTLTPSADDLLSPEEAIRDLLPALREGRRYLVTHGPVPPSYDERVAQIREAIDRATGGER